jgi:hypothetical protein
MEVFRLPKRELTLVSGGLEAGKPLRKKVKTGSGNAECTSLVLVIIPYAIDYKGW